MQRTRAVNVRGADARALEDAARAEGARVFGVDKADVKLGDYAVCGSPEGDGAYRAEIIVSYDGELPQAAGGVVPAESVESLIRRVLAGRAELNADAMIAQEPGLTSCGREKVVSVAARMPDVEWRSYGWRLKAPAAAPAAAPAPADGLPDWVGLYVGAAHIAAGTVGAAKCGSAVAAKELFSALLDVEVKVEITRPSSVVARVTVCPAEGGTPLARYEGGADLVKWTRRWDEHFGYQGAELPGEGLFMLQKVTQ